MDEQAAWNCFFYSGKVDDYLNYIEIKKQDKTISEESAYADKDKSDCIKAPQYR